MPTSENIFTVIFYATRLRTAYITEYGAPPDDVDAVVVLSCRTALRKI
jgi:hypothetical protein